ncbi:hypothetical protein [Knoellia pratensis]
MGSLTLEQQFAVLPEHLQGALIGLLDAVSNAGRLGQLADANRFLRQVARLESMPEPAKALIMATSSVATSVVLDQHSAKLEWARSEGFTGFDAFLGSQGPPGRKQVA